VEPEVAAVAEVHASFFNRPAESTPIKDAFEPAEATEAAPSTFGLDPSELIAGSELVVVADVVPSYPWCAAPAPAPPRSASAHPRGADALWRPRQVHGAGGQCANPDRDGARRERAALGRHGRRQHHPRPRLPAPGPPRPPRGLPARRVVPRAGAGPAPSRLWAGARSSSTR
jgi:hypothetical protein